jgi:hypothetical protein
VKDLLPSRRRTKGSCRIGARTPRKCRLRGLRNYGFRTMRPTTASMTTRRRRAPLPG